MTDNEIVKALECCNADDVGSCNDCPLVLNNEDLENCEKRVRREVIDLINRQKAEIERLRKETSQTIESIRKLARDTIRDAKAEAIKEFAEKVVTTLDERVSENIRNRNPHWYIAKRIVRETAIEMTE